MRKTSTHLEEAENFLGMFHPPVRFEVIEGGGLEQHGCSRHIVSLGMPPLVTPLFPNPNSNFIWLEQKLVTLNNWNVIKHRARGKMLQHNDHCDYYYYIDIIIPPLTKCLHWTLSLITCIHIVKLSTQGSYGVWLNGRRKASVDAIPTGLQQRSVKVVKGLHSKLFPHYRMSFLSRPTMVMIQQSNLLHSWSECDLTCLVPLLILIYFCEEIFGCLAFSNATTTSVNSQQYHTKKCILWYFFPLAFFAAVLLNLCSGAR